MSEYQKPEILHSRWVAHSRLFHVEEQRLRFGNGVERTYERLNPGFHGAVMVVAVGADDRLLLVREYGGGIGDYYLSFPKGALQEEESVLDAANRELMEETGFGAHELEVLSEMALSPSYMGNRITIVLARKLFEKKLPGDEPEPPQVCWHGFEELLALQARRELQEAYAVAALFLARERLRGNAAA
ncbi:MAG: ADP compounds hydrolase NudE [Gammaproteobacteria bacterium]|jgi:ADP-ribose diphosphatase|nr:ADP compounds hydrolase NudE [Gammaproteobacteria bacterium]MBP6052532.1 ADP compounds hydrolase NudE [Pseudomonadales bacterium]MBK6583091.1 ADP compounds hydrolase NudE [Gammaproteobacteria bacterium]MBK7519220.1 ADP compounds hydrolase NudE [Gammaproteobacteria bacterium]MBK7730040.1 ADP compounds hydrolase NudE [Gammaproteobacteria bacterium]